MMLQFQVLWLILQSQSFSCKDWEIKRLCTFPICTCFQVEMTWWHALSLRLLTAFASPCCFWFLFFNNPSLCDVCSQISLSLFLLLWISLTFFSTFKLHVLTILYVLSFDAPVIDLCKFHILFSVFLLFFLYSDSFIRNFLEIAVICIEVTFWLFVG